MGVMCYACEDILKYNSIQINYTFGTPHGPWKNNEYTVSLKIFVEDRYKDTKNTSASLPMCRNNINSQL